MSGLLRARRWRVGCGRAAGVGLVWLALLAHAASLGYGFTGSDSLSLIASSRIQTPADVVRLTTEPILSGTDFAAVFRYFRPFNSFSYSLDYLVWGLEPAGYHLTDVLLHCLVAAATLAVLRRPLRQSWPAAWLAAFTFAAHPIAAEVVPSISRRHQPLATLLMLLALLCFDRVGRPGGGRGRWLALAVLSAALAMATLEVAFALPWLLLAWAYLTTAAGPVSGRVWAATRRTWPFFAAAAVCLAWHTVVVRGLGGMVAPLSGPAPQRRAAAVAGAFWRDLLDPAGLAPALPAWLATGLALAAVALLAYFWWRRGRLGWLAWWGVWLLLPWLLYALTGNYARRSLYFPAVALGAVVALTMSDGAGWLRQAGTARPRAGAAETAAAGLLVAAGAVLLVFWLAWSPLLRPYPQWRYNGAVASRLLPQLTLALAGAPTEGLICVRELPGAVGRSESRGSPMKEVSALSGYAIKSWLDLTRPGNRWRVRVVSIAAGMAQPETLGWHLRPEGDGALAAEVTPQGGLPGHRGACR